MAFQQFSSLEGETIVLERNPALYIMYHMKLIDKPVTKRIFGLHFL